MVGILGIVNVTRDSFSDGGRFLDPGAALAHADRLLAAGADVLDVGAESTHPDAEDVAAADEIARLEPVLRGLRARGAAVSVDTRKPEVMHAALALGAAWLNDVDGFRSADAMAVVRAAPRATRFVAMFSRSERGRAGRPAEGTADLLAAIRAFFVDRVAAFAAAGVARDRLVLDPGMGFFLGAAPAHSLLVLKHLPALQRDFAPLLVSVSRKSFVGALTGAPAGERGPGTLAAELWAVRAGVEWIRTHDVGALRSALVVEQAIEGSA